MERFQGWNPKVSKFLRTALALAMITVPLASAPTAIGGTRMIPPPPPRHQDDKSVDGIQQESEWGVFTGAGSQGIDRWQALRDDEGEEIDFNHGTLSRVNRAPAGLEINGKQKAAKGSTDAAPAAAGSTDSGWKSTPVDDDRTATKEAMTSEGKRPVLKRVTKTEAARQEAEAEKFVADVSDPVARRKGVQEISIIAGDLGFFPKTIFVSRDVPVRLYVTGASKGSLCIMMDSFNVRKQVRANKIEEITFVPNQPGTYRYYCPVNGSEGTMVVKELTTSGPGEG